MQVLLQRHEFPVETTDGNRFCLHCGGLYHPQMTMTCLQRAIPQSDLAPEPKRREYAVDDAETISARIIELAAERVRDGEPEPEPHMDPGDCCG